MAEKLTVVTGPTGQVGMHLVDELLARGDRVRALVLKGDDGLADRDVEQVVGDVRDPDCMRRVCEGADVVHHLAAVVSTSDTPGSLLWSVNVDGARNAARQARLAGVRKFVHFSSIVVFDQTGGRPLDEETPRVGGMGCAPYSRSKVLGERAVRAEAARGLDAVVVHPTVVVGPYETHHSGIVQNFIAKQQRGQLPALVNGGFNVVDARDVVTGALAAAERGRTGESYILGGHWHSVHEFARIAQTVGIGAAPRIRLPMWMARAALPAATLGAKLLRKRPPFNAEELNQLDGNPDIRCDKAVRELGYAPRPIDDSLRRCQAWLDQELQA